MRTLQWLILALAILGALAFSACYMLLHDESGREYTIGFTTPRTIPQTHALTTSWLADRTDFQVVESRERFIRAEMVPAQRPNQVDVLSISFDTDPEGTRVSANAKTFNVSGGRRTQADEVSGDAVGAAKGLADMLTRPTSPPPG